MRVVEYGEHNKDTIILLHGGGLSWWNYRDVANILKNDYHVILPILDGHANSDRDFTSIEDNADEVIEYIDNNYRGKVKLIGGLSLGGQILLDILSKRNSICDYAIIESALVYPMKLTNRLVEPFTKLSYFLISKEWFSKLQFKNLRINKTLFYDYYNDSSKITKNNLIAILKANTNYNLKDIQNNKAKSLIVVGNKEKAIMRDSARKIHSMLSNSELEIIDKYYHGEFSINHPTLYVDRIKKLLE